MNNLFYKFLRNTGIAIVFIIRISWSCAWPVIKYTFWGMVIAILGMLVGITFEVIRSRITNSITKHDDHYIYSDTLMHCPDPHTSTYAIADTASNATNRHDVCIHCKQSYRKHIHVQSQYEKDVNDAVMEMRSVNPN